MTSTDTLLPCPFCGGEPVLTEHPPHEHSPILKRVMPDFPDHKGSADVSCLDCAVGHLRDTPTKAIAAWNRRTPPTPAADANPFVGTNWQVRADTPATDTPGTYGTMTPTIEVVPPHYPLATEEREAVAQWCSGCHEVRSVDCYRAGCPKSDTERLAAEILAAEARGIKRARTVVQDTRDGMKLDPSATLEWRNAITGGFNAADLALRHELDAIERGEHGAGK